MAVRELEVSKGPNKADLLRAVTNPEKHLHVVFHSASGIVEAHLDKIDETGVDGVSFGLAGHIASGDFGGVRFSGVYDTESRSGKLVLQDR